MKLDEFLDERINEFLRAEESAKESSLMGLIEEQKITFYSEKHNLELHVVVNRPIDKD